MTTTPVPPTASHAAAGSSAPLVLGIESSCDETAVGIVRGTELLANTVASSMDEHARFGGVVPEVAARAHAQAIGPVLREAIATAQVSLQDLDAIAVTAGPGLIGALMVGIGAAKGLAVATGRPLYGVNHLVGHVGSRVLEEGALELPTIALLVSGGHTALLRVDDLVDGVTTLGETIDDAAGEAFDKTARLLGLGYPGGPRIQEAAEHGDPTAVRFPRGLSLPRDLVRHRYDFSFSGLKTAVAREVARREQAARDTGAAAPSSAAPGASAGADASAVSGLSAAAGVAGPGDEDRGFADEGGLPGGQVADLAASFQAAVVDVLLTKAFAACRDLGIPRLLLGGGVVANSALRDEAARRAASEGVDLHIPPLSLCTDNGAMIAALGAQLAMAGARPSGLGFGADSTLPVEVARVA